MRSRFVPVLVIVSALAAIALVATLAIIGYVDSDATGFTGFLVRHHLPIMILLVIVSVAAGGVTVGVLARQRDRSRSAAHDAATMLLDFVAPDERTVLEALAARDGTALQSQLGTATGLGPVKMHRLALRLAAKRFVSVERYGKTNRITLAPHLREALR
jgi:uncharacterized membrane protein